MRYVKIGVLLIGVRDAKIFLGAGNWLFKSCSSNWEKVFICLPSRLPACPGTFFSLIIRFNLFFWYMPTQLLLK